MKIALDATPLTVSTGGIARYTRELVQALAVEFPNDEYVLLSDQPFPTEIANIPNLIAHPVPNSLLRCRWWSLGLPAELCRLDAALFHGTDFAVPYLPLKPAVMTLHDLSPWKDPAWHTAANRIRTRTPLLLKLGLATMIITPTEAIRREAVEHFRISPAQIAAVPLAASDHFRPVSAPPPHAPYFLYVGVLEPRKNLTIVIDAWRRLRQDYEVDLVLAGRKRDDFPALPAEPGLHLAGEVPEEHLPALYSAAIAFLYPSLYEGFGLPVLEAMRCGAPVLTSSDPALAEVAGEAAVRLSATEPLQWFTAMKTALTNPEWRAGLREASLQTGPRFSWPHSARMTREVYQEATERFGG